MDWRTVGVGLYELIVSIVFGQITVFVAVKAISGVFLRGGSFARTLEWNTAASLFAGTMILAALILVNESVLPSADAMRAMMMGASAVTPEMVLIALGYLVALFAIALAVSAAVIYLTTQVYLVATVHVDEMKEIRRNNVPVAILLCAVVLGMALFIRPALQRFVGSLVNYDALTRQITDAGEQAPAEGREDYLVPAQRKPVNALSSSAPGQP
jgi:hypothetical protein